MEINLILDPAKFAVREKGPKGAFFFPTKKFSKTGIDKKLLELYNVRVKRNPATAHLSTYGQGSINRITDNDGKINPTKKALRKKCLIKWWSGKSL